MLKVDERVVGPKLLLDFFSCDELPRARSEQDEDLERLGLELDETVAFSQLAGLEIDGERVEPEPMGSRNLSAHPCPPPRERETYARAIQFESKLPRRKRLSVSGRGYSFQEEKSKGAFAIDCWRRNANLLKRCLYRPFDLARYLGHTEPPAG
jgi:hypothetical protein